MLKYCKFYYIRAYKLICHWLSNNLNIYLFGGCSIQEKFLTVREWNLGEERRWEKKKIGKRETMRKQENIGVRTEEN